MCFAIGWSGRVDPDGNIYGFVHTKGTVNDAGFSNAQLDLTLDNARKATTEKARITLYANAMRIIHRQRPLIYLWHPVQYDGVSKKVDGVQMYADGLIRAGSAGFVTGESRQTGRMGGFLLRKAGAALVVLFLASVVVFGGVRALPGDPALALGGEERDPAVLAEIRHKYGLDEPVPVQYAKWAWLALQGDLGTDSRQLSVSHTIVSRIPITLELAGLAILIGMLIGIPAGVIAAVRRGKGSDYAATSGALVGLSIPISGSA